MCPQAPTSRIDQPDRSVQSVQSVHSDLADRTDRSAYRLDPDAVLDELLDCGITHAITVPDYVMMSVYRAIEAQSRLRLVYACTEDEAVTMAAGLHVGGARPMVMMQNQGLYASCNAVRAVGLDARLPLFMMIGQFGRESANLGRPRTESTRAVVRGCERLLDAMDIPYLSCERAADVGNVGAAYRLAERHQSPAAVLVGTYTAWPTPAGSTTTAGTGTTAASGATVGTAGTGTTAGTAGTGGTA